MKKSIAALLLASTVASAAYRVVGYVPDYRPEALANIHWQSFSHIMAAFLNPDAAGNFTPSTALTDIVTEAKKTAGLKVYVSIAGGGADLTQWGSLINASNRSATAQKIANAAKAMGVDGVDVDLEGSIVQSASYAPFISELKKALTANQLNMTAAVAKWTSSSVADSTFGQFEFINLMAYDYTGPWATTGNHQHSSIKQAQDELSYYGTTRKIAKDKIVLGVPFYGYDFADLANVSAFTWAEIVNSHPSAMDVDTLVTGTEAKYYNGRPTIRQKSKMAIPYGGTMIWELGQDYFPYGSKSLLYQIDQVKDSLNNLVVPVLDWKPSSALVPGASYKIWSLDGILLQEDLAGPQGQFELKGLGAGTYLLESQFKRYRLTLP